MEEPALQKQGSEFMALRSQSQGDAFGKAQQLNQGVIEKLLDIFFGVLFVSFLDKQKGKREL